MITERVPVRALLGLILVAALAWRLNNIGFGLPSMYDPDEPIFMITALKLLSEGTLNPGWFGHPGSTTIYLVALIDVVVAAVGVASGSYDGVESFAKAAYANPALLFIPARAAMALIGTGCVALTYVVGKRLGGAWVGIVAAALLAFNGHHITWSQVIRTDIHASLFMLASIIFALRIAGGGTARDYVLAGVFAGLATATKWPAATIFIATIGAHLHAVRAGGAVQRPRLTLLMLAGLAVPVTMFLASPYLLLDWQRVLVNAGGEVRTGHPGHTSLGPFNNLWQYLSHPVAGSMGWVALPGIAIGIALLARRNVTSRWTILPATALFLLLICGQNIIWSRWILPVFPFLCIFLAIPVVAIGRMIAARLAGARQIAALCLLTLIAGGPTLSAAVAGAKERANDTRMRAARWAIQNVPPGSTIAYEHLEIGVRNQPWTILFPLGSAGCIDGVKAMTSGVKFEDVQTKRGSSPIVVLGNVAPDKIDTCRADFAVLTFHETYRVERDQYPLENWTYDRVLAGGKTVALFLPERGVSGGPPVRIVKIDRSIRATGPDENGLANPKPLG